MTTYNYLNQIYEREAETLREIGQNGEYLVSAVDKDIRYANMYAFGADIGTPGNNSIEAVRVWDVLTE